MNGAELNSVLIDKLRPFASKKRAEFSVGYIKSNYEVLGCSVPNIRLVAKQTIAELEANYSHAELRALMTALWNNSSNFEVMHVPLYYFSDCVEHYSKSDWRVLKTWASKIDNWAHSDWLSSIYAAMLERIPEVYDVLLKWNNSINPWKRRLSLTSLYYYSNAREKYLSAKKVLPMVKNVLDDPDMYVQKAVGWTLRECGNIHPKETKSFINQHAGELSATAFSSATEKWSAEEKEDLKRIRKTLRKAK